VYGVWCMVYGECSVRWVWWVRCIMYGVYGECGVWFMSMAYGECGVWWIQLKQHASLQTHTFRRINSDASTRRIHWPSPDHRHPWRPVHDE
jgi:hypothetical protein